MLNSFLEQQNNELGIDGGNSLNNPVEVELDNIKTKSAYQQQLIKGLGSYNTSLTPKKKLQEHEEEKESSNQKKLANNSKSPQHKPKHQIMEQMQQ